MNRLLARAKNYSREKKKKKTDYTAGKTKRVCHGPVSEYLPSTKQQKKMGKRYSFRKTTAIGMSEKETQ